MSRVGKQPITIKEGVNVNIDKNIVTVTGPQGSLTLKVPVKINVEIKDNQVLVTRLSEAKMVKAQHGAIRAHINNMVEGVLAHWKKQLEIKGTGYKASVSGNKLTLNVGFIHPVDIIAPEGVLIQINPDSTIMVTGADKTLVGQTASNIRKVKPPEPYKGKGIKYLGEVIKLKAGKKAKSGD